MSVSFAIIGCGRIAVKHAEEICKLGNLVAVCDIDPTKAAYFAKTYTATAYYNLTDLLANEKNIDVVSICTPNGLHALQTIECLKANKHVLCEKPMSISTADAHNMIAAAEAAHKRLFIVKSARHNPLVIALKKLIDDNVLGKIFSFTVNCVWNRPTAYFSDEWRGTLALDGGTLYTQFSHYIDIVCWLLGKHSNMSGYRKNVNHTNCIEFEDTGVISLQMKNGAIGTIHYSINAFEKNQEISLNIVAEHTTIKLGGTYMNEIVYQHPVLINKDILAEINTENNYGFYKGSVSNHDKIYENVVNALSGKENIITDGNDALATVSFIEEFYNSTPLS